jgi:heme oxygenase
MQDALQGLHERLKRLTGPFHEELENCDYPSKLAQCVLSWDDYKSYLIIFHSLHKQLELAFLGYNEWNEHGIDILSRCRLKLLEKDLILMGIDPSKLTNQIHINSPGSFAEAIGILYVLEGSTNGGQFLAKKIDLLFKDRPEGICNNYFLSYGEETKDKWHKYCQFLNSFGNDYPEKVDEVIIGACNGFLMIKKVLDNNGIESL